MSPEITWDAQRLLTDVAEGPEGPAVGAFFDFDGTLIDGYSLGAFARHHLRSGHVTPLDAGRMLLLGLRGVTTEADFERFFVLGMRAWAGRSEDELAELGERLFVQGIAGSLYPEAWRLVEAHRRAGHTVVLASSATRFQVEPAARAMGVEHVLVTPVEIENGIATGRPGGPPLWRRGKAEAVRAFAPRHGIDLEASYAYSNGTEDVPFLSTVGRARALNPEPGLALVATEKGWPVVRFRPRGRAGLRQIARTAAAAVGTVGGFGAGVALGALNGSRRDGVDLGHRARGRAGHRARRGAARRARRRAPGVGPARGVPVQPPEPARRPHPREAAARRLHRRREEGGGQRPGVRADVPPRRHGVRRPRQHHAGQGRARARGGRGCGRGSRWSSRRRAPARPRRRWARSRRAPSTSPCRPGCRSCRS